MHRRFTYGAGALLTSALTFFAFAGAGVASEQLPAGDYNLVVPGVGDIAFSVDDTGAVTVGTLPDGFTLVVDEEEEGELEAILSNGDITVKLEIEDGKVELKVEDGLAPGTYEFTLADGSTLTVEVAEDGTVTVTGLPDGYQLVEGEEDDIVILAPDGTMYKLELGDEEIELKVVEDEADDESDDQSDDEADDDSDDADDQSDDEADDSDDGSDDASDDDGSDDASEEAGED